MTKSEYLALNRAARRQYPKLTLRGLSEMRKAYKAATSAVADELKKAVLTNKSDLTIGSLKSILEQLAIKNKTIAQQITMNAAIDNKINYHVPNWAEVKRALSAAAESIRAKLEVVIPGTVGKGLNVLSGINEDYLIDITGLTAGKITKTGLSNMFVMVNDYLLSSMVTRIWSDGYGYSTRVWNVGQIYQDDIRRIIMSGLAQGRDIIKIAGDLNAYVASGKQTLIKRYGPLIRGTAAFRRRIRQNIFYPSLRLIRSELYASLQDSAAWMGRINPACTGLYDWIRNISEVFNCNCPANAAGSPYTYQTIPSYDHPNCACTIQARIRGTTEFKADIIKWVETGQSSYLNDWYNNYYQRAA